MSAPLASVSDLAGFAAAPSHAALVAAGEAIRTAAGWHIAPEIETTEYVESRGGQEIFLRTLHLVEVTEVVDADTGTAVTGWWPHPTVQFRAGCVTRPGGWPHGVLAVTYRHGHEEIPAELLPVIMAVSQAQGVTHGGGSVRLGSLSITPSTSSTDIGVVTATSVVDRYTIPAAP